jgi:hypothetical protein
VEHATPAAILLIIAFIGPVLYGIRRASQGKEIFIRRIAGMNAIDDAVGRSVELGRPLVFTSGTAGVGPLLYACLEVLRHVAKKSAMFGSKLYVPCLDPEVLVLSDATMQNAYRAANRSSRYEPENIRFLSDEQFAYASGYMGLVHRENVGGAFLFGSFAAESLILAEAGQQVGAIQVAGTTSNEQIPFFITSCDYTIIGEEVFAAGAYLSRDPVQSGSLWGQDIAKLIIGAFILLGIAEATWREASGEKGVLYATRFLKSSWEDILPGGKKQ